MRPAAATIHRNASLPLRAWRAAVVQVSKKKAESWAQAKGGMPYYETSAKDDINVEPAFTHVARNALKHEKEEDL